MGELYDFIAEQFRSNMPLEFREIITVRMLMDKYGFTSEASYMIVKGFELIQKEAVSKSLTDITAHIVTILGGAM